MELLFLHAIGRVYKLCRARANRIDLNDRLTLASCLKVRHVCRQSVYAARREGHQLVGIEFLPKAQLPLASKDRVESLLAVCVRHYLRARRHLHTHDEW